MGSERVKSSFNKDFNTNEFNGDRNKVLSLDKYVTIIKSNLQNLADKLKECGEWKTQLSRKIVFRSSKDVDENLDIYSWNDNKEIMMTEKTN